MTSLNLCSNRISDITALADLRSLTELDLGGNEIQDITALADMRNLAYLSLVFNRIKDISALAGLEGLTYLDVGSNEVSDVSPLTGLTRLTHLRLEGNRIRDVSPLMGLLNLTHLRLGVNQFSNVTSLSSLTNLTELSLYSLALPHDDLATLLSSLPKLTTLDISGNYVSDLSMVSHLTELTILSASGNKSSFSDLSPLSGLKNLTDLDIGGNRVKDTSVLAHLNKLTKVQLDSNRVEDLSPLSEMTGLTYLSVKANPLNPEAYTVNILLILAHNPGVTLMYDPPSLAEITVLYNGIIINNGDVTPDTADGTDFGTVIRGNAPVSHAFVVRNDGTAMLTFKMFGTATVVPTGFTWKGGPRDLAPGESDTLTIQLDTAVPGIKTGDFSFSNNDQDENPFHFRITGTVADITILGNGLVIRSNDSTPDVADGTDFGTVVRGSAPISHTFAIRNDGECALTFDMGSFAVPTGFTLTEGLSASLAPGTSDAFTVRLETDAMGTKTGDLLFVNNDSDEDLFRFRITGTVVDRGPEITVRGNGISIGEGGTTPSVDDGTDFGIVLQHSTPIVRTFTVRNDGIESLALGAPTVPGGFTLAKGLSASLAPGASDAFTIRLDTAVIGAKTGDVVLNGHGDESLFAFSDCGSCDNARRA